MTERPQLLAEEVEEIAKAAEAIKESRKNIQESTEKVVYEVFDCTKKIHFI